MTRRHAWTPLAAVAAIAKHNDDDDHRKSRDNYCRGDNYAFDDRGYLTRECSQEIRAHIDRDHGKVASYGGSRGGNREYQRGVNDGRDGREFDPYPHPQDYKDGYRDGERARWRN